MARLFTWPLTVMPHDAAPERPDNRYRSAREPSSHSVMTTLSSSWLMWEPARATKSARCVRICLTQAAESGALVGSALTEMRGSPTHGGGAGAAPASSRMTACSPEAEGELSVSTNVCPHRHLAGCPNDS